MQSWACLYEDCRGDNTIGVSGVILDVFARYEPPQRRRNAAESPHRPDVVAYPIPGPAGTHAGIRNRNPCPRSSPSPLPRALNLKRENVRAVRGASRKVPSTPFAIVSTNADAGWPGNVVFGGTAPLNDFISNTCSSADQPDFPKTILDLFAPDIPRRGGDGATVPSATGSPHFRPTRSPRRAPQCFTVHPVHSTSRQCAPARPLYV